MEYTSYSKKQILIIGIIEQFEIVERRTEIITQKETRSHIQTKKYLKAIMDLKNRRKA